MKSLTASTAPLRPEPDPLRCARCDSRVAEAAGPAVLTVLAVLRRAHSERDVHAVTDA